MYSCHLVYKPVLLCTYTGTPGFNSGKADAFTCFPSGTAVIVPYRATVLSVDSTKAL